MGGIEGRAVGKCGSAEMQKPQEGIVTIPTLQSVIRCGAASEYEISHTL